MKIFKVIFFIAGVVGLNAMKPVTNEDIRGAILSVVNVMRSTEDKLERHEFRERALGEQLKKALVNIDKRLKFLDPVKGTVSRLDERLATVETILMQKDERERIQLQKTVEAVEDIQKNLPLMIEQMQNTIIEKISKQTPQAAPSVTDDSIKTDIKKLSDDLSARIKDIENNLHNVKNSTTSLSNNLLNLKDATESVKNSIKDKSDADLEKVAKHLNSTEELLEKYENKLAEYNNRVPTEINVPANFEEKKNWQGAFLQALEVQKVNVEEILADIRDISRKIDGLPDKSDLENTRNVTLDILQELREDLNANNVNSASNLNNKFEKMRDFSEKQQKDLSNSLEKISKLTEVLAENMSNSYLTLHDEIEELSKVEEVMVQTADSVLDTRRKVEYGVHQILSEVGGLIKTYAKDTGAIVNERFDIFESQFFDSDTGALANLTAKIGEEIDQVWRQIGIMHQQMSASTDTLNKLQNQTDVYVNGSVSVMDSMKGKVGQITGRMTEVDENLNYLLGRLSLVTQEFNQIKSGLGTALDEIRASFLAVQQKVKDAGPGPHKIEDNEGNDIQEQ